MSVTDRRRRRSSLEDPASAAEALDVVAFLERVGVQLPLLDANRAGSELFGAPRLNAFDLFEPNENALSRIVEDLLDPAGSHGQGMLFLDVLLREIGLPGLTIGEPVHTRREVPTAAGRRIDLVVETSSILVGFENKPWASQRPRQLRDYLEALQGWARGRRTALIFLSDQEPESGKGSVIVIPYARSAHGPSLSSLLDAALTRVKAPRARIHVEEFISYIDWQFGDGEMIYDSDVPYVEAVEKTFAEQQHRRSAGAVLLAAGRLHRRVLDEIGECLVGALSEIADDFEVVDEMALSDCLADRWSTWEVRRPSWPANLSIALESNKVAFGDVSYGVKAPDPKDREIRAERVGCPVRPQVEAALRSFGGGSRTKWWPWWRHAATRRWGQEFAGGLVLHSPTGAIADHPEIAALRNAVVELARAVEDAVSI